MAVDLDTFTIVLLFAPFLAALIAPPLARETGRAAGWILAIVPAGLFAVLLTFLGRVAAGERILLSLDWVPALDIKLSFMIDGLGLTFALLITGIGAFILVYSGEYLHGHRRLGRFLSTLLLFMGAMLGLVLADSFPVLFAFWELTAVSSFLLIGFHNTHQASRRAATHALIITGLGGLSLMAGGVLLHVFTGTWAISPLAQFATVLKLSPAYPWVVGFMAVAAFTKSAQLPFHFWLPNAMEAPTPVSAYLHSATMVQAGVYLLARMSPSLSGMPLWEILLGTFGAITLVWGALGALKQTDMKRMLAWTTVSSLGLLVLLLGLGGTIAATAVAVYFVAHALYKAGLFLAGGIVDHATGTRDITRLGGLRDELTITFIATAIAGLSMLGLPPFLGYLAKEEMYLGLHFGSVPAIAILIAMVIGNALLGGAALALVIRPFMGHLRPTPQTPHEGSFGLWIGPVVFGLCGFAAFFALAEFGQGIVAPMAWAIYGTHFDLHLSFAIDPFSLPIWLSVATWVIAGLVYWQLDRIRALMLRTERRFTWTFDRGFDTIVLGLVRFAGDWTRLFHHGRLELYLVIAFATLALALWLPLLELGAAPALPELGALTFYEWGAIILAVAGVATVVFARSRLFAILALGVQGLAVGLIFLFFGAPDLGFTQLIIEVLSVVILALVMTRLRLTTNDPRPLEDWLRDGTLALVCGVALSALLLRVLQHPFDTRLSDFFAENSAAVAYGRNIVNVILVDFRGLDTLGEISVVMTAGIAVLALLRRQHKRKSAPPPDVNPALASETAP